MSRVEESLRAQGMRAEAAGSRAALLARVENTLRGKGAEVHHRIHVPGRIEVLGKHTDYALSLIHI